MLERFYVPYKRVEEKLQPIAISTDLSSVIKLLSSREIDGYLIGSDYSLMNYMELPWATAIFEQPLPPFVPETSERPS